MKLTLNIVGETIQDIENALDIFMEEVKNKTLESNCYCGSIGDGKKLCEEKYTEICNQIINTLCGES